MEIERLIGVYRADSGLKGELRYLRDHYLRGTSCSLCEITHGRVRRRREWGAAISCLDIPFDLRHLNEIDPDVRAHVGDSAAMVVAVTSTGLVTLISNAELASMDGDITAFMNLLTTRLEDAAKPSI